MMNVLLQGLAAVGTAVIVLAVMQSVKQLCLRLLLRFGCSCQFR